MDKAEMKRWVSDLQSHLYVNCVYCGHRYGPFSEDVPQQALSQHIRECVEHPMHHLILASRKVLERFGDCDAYNSVTNTTCIENRAYLLKNQGLHSIGTRFADLCDSCFVRVTYEGLL